MPRSRLFALPLLLASGCSLAFTRGPGPVADPARPIECSTSPVAPLLDGAVAAAGATLAVAGATAPSCKPGAFVCSDAWNRQATTIGLVTGLVYGASTLYGAVNTGRCRDARALQVSCQSGQELACQQLTSGWKPPPPVQAPRPPATLQLGEPGA